jgi:hypothetical protein
MRRLLLLAIAAACLVPSGSRAGGAIPFTPDGSVYFNDPTDSIQVDGQTVLGTDSTYEAVIHFPAATGAAGYIFNEWMAFQEDKQFGAGPGGFHGYNHPVGGGNVILYAGSLAVDSVHHVAFVQDSSASEQRLYLDGDLVATAAQSGEIADSDGPGFVGSIFRDGIQNSSFRGFIDSFRISDMSRYSGPDIGVPITEDLPNDANTVLLYNFNAPDFFVDQGKVRITDLSGNGRTGTLGAGPAGSPTSPEPPAKHGDVDCSGGINAVDALKLLRSSAALSVSQTEPCPDIGENLLPALFGDVDCSAAVNSVDALKVLRYNASLSVDQTLPCPQFNQPT